MIKYMKKNWMGWLGAALVLIGYVFNAHQSIFCWPIWIAGNGFVGFYSIEKEAYPTVVMSFVLVVANIYGWTHWAFYG